MLGRLLIAWAAAWPTITGLLMLLDGVIGTWPLALRTLVLTAIIVPVISVVMVPLLTKALKLLGAAYRTKRLP